MITNLNNEMKKAIKKKWLSALTGGEYKQGTGCLRKADMFCCLGVLCDLYSKEKGIEWDMKARVSKILGSDDVLPREVMEWAGLSDSNPDITFPKAERALASMNDSGVTFKELAVHIKKQL